MAELTGVRGAIYFPSRAFNHYQTWESYSRSAVHSDLICAKDLGLNALRVLVSFEFWRDHPERLERALDSFFELAGAHGIDVLPVMFESIGAEPTEKNLNDRDVTTAFAVRSPSGRVLTDRKRWDEPRRFVEWFVSRYGGRDNLLAVEIMNEPGEWKKRVDFCRAMLRAARDADPSVPLTMGCKDFEFNELYEDPTLDVYQFHFNLPPTADDMRAELREAAAISERTCLPIWLTEWQRTRVEPPNKLLPNYSSLASVIRESDIDGDFFWQLMLKPAYIEKPRKQGRLNGLFHENGEIYSTSDARALSGEVHFHAERPEWPEWARPVYDRWYDPDPNYEVAENPRWRRQ